jgi:hypothetical protein
MKNLILLTTPVRPYSKLPGNESLTDTNGQRFTKGNDIFTLISHTHSYANHILAQNIKTPSILLEYPHWDDFTAEVDKGYPRRSDPLIDDYIIKAIANRTLLAF